MDSTESCQPPAWLLILDYLLDLPAGSFVSYDDLSEVISRDYRRSRIGLEQVQAELLLQRNVLLENVRNQGYWLINATAEERLCRAARLLRVRERHIRASYIQARNMIVAAANMETTSDAAAEAVQQRDWDTAMVKLMDAMRDAQDVREQWADILTAARACGFVMPTGYRRPGVLVSIL